ncbi:MAG: VRR-NUC domain-containing protein [Betaproteobacteria bacterium]|nr:VRR-NUC domain-containing protein [Betaproteobacteria bacterium]
MKTALHLPHLPPFLKFGRKNLFLFGERWAAVSAPDLFGFEPTPTPRTNDRPEAAALSEVLKALHGHPDVAWAHRQNTGAAKMGKSFIRFGWAGCSDVLGQLKDGRLLAVEVKSPNGRLRPEQAEFLSLVRRFGGVAFVARDCADVARELVPTG